MAGLMFACADLGGRQALPRLMARYRCWAGTRGLCRLAACPVTVVAVIAPAACVLLFRASGASVTRQNTCG